MPRSRRKVSVAAMAILLAGILSACQTSGEWFLEQKQVAEADNDVLFYAPGLAEGYRKFLTGRTASYDHLALASYGPKKGSFPVAEIILNEAMAGRHIQIIGGIEGYLKKWKRLEDVSNWQHQEKGFIENGLGSAEYLAASASDADCVVFRQYWKPSFYNGFNKWLFGYYCVERNGPIKLDPKAVLSNLGHREDAPISPPPGWAEQVVEAKQEVRTSLKEPVATNHLPLEVTWEGREGTLEGTLHVPVRKKSGQMTFRLENGMECKGEWTWFSGEYGKGMVTGSWAASCPSGDRATGFYNSEKPLTGYGKGFDTKGNKIIVRFGSKKDQLSLTN